MHTETQTLWTVGHSTRSLDDFIQMLNAHRIGILADVRQFAGSRKYPHFGKENLRDAMKECGIDYVHLPELGGRRKPRPGSRNTNWRNESFRGYADYMESAEFREGIARLQGLLQEKPAAI